MFCRSVHRSADIVTWWNIAACAHLLPLFGTVNLYHVLKAVVGIIFLHIAYFATPKCNAALVLLSCWNHVCICESIKLSQAIYASSIRQSQAISMFLRCSGFVEIKLKNVHEKVTPNCTEHSYNNLHKERPLCLRLEQRERVQDVPLNKLS